MRRRYGRRRAVWIAPLLIGLVIILIIKGFLYSPSGTAAEAVNEFYQYEQEGNFSKSWEMFHPFMKEKFQKGHYLQDRAHVFMNHFGVETFSYTLGEAKKLENWKPSKDGPKLKIVYKVPVTQVYEGKYGTFSLQQDVYVVKQKEKWLVLWDYN